MLLRLALLFALAIPATGVEACTTLLLGQGEALLFGRNYDWNIEDALVVANKRDVTKTAFSFDNPAQWTSKYGSVTFNQYGREFPNDGMNEKGLVVAVMWLRSTQYPSPDERPSVTSAQWVQYQLDTAATVEEVIASDSGLRITPIAASQVHYLVADASGDCAAIEFIDGKMVVHRGEQMLAPVLANSTYEESAKFLEQCAGFGGEAPIVLSRSSLGRFAQAAEAVRRVNAGEADATPDYVFDTLGRVAQGDRTQWSIVYDIADRQVVFRSQWTPEKKLLSFDDVDFSSDSPVKVLDLKAPVSGDIADEMVDYTTEANKRLIQATFKSTWFLRAMPSLLRDQLVAYPEASTGPSSELTGASSSGASSLE